MVAESNLPPCVYFKHGAYYLVKKNKWTRIPSPHAPVAVLDALKRRFAYCKASAKARKIEFIINENDVIFAADSAGWRCAVTNAPFSLKRIGRMNRAPFAPSIDRIDSSKGYIPGNVRVVCLFANLAMNEWGEQVLTYLMTQMLDIRQTDRQKTA